MYSLLKALCLCSYQLASGHLIKLYMKHVIIIASLLIFCNCRAASQKIVQSDSLAEIHEKDLINKPFPSFRLSNGKTELTNEVLLGKVVYINFWFKACVPCMQEMPQINELFDKFKSDTNFILISITYDNIEKIETTKEKFKIQYNIYPVTHNESLRLNPTHTYPANIILNKNGVIEFYETGNAFIGFLITRYFRKKIYTKIEDLLNGQ